MIRTRSVPNTWRMPNPSRVCSFARGTVGQGRIAVALTFLIVLGRTAPAAGAWGPGLGIKVGAQTIEDPVDLDKTTRPRLEVELSSPLLWNQHVDFALTFGGSFLGSHSERYTDVVDDILIDDRYTDRLWLFDIRLAARLYPLGDRSRLRPYVGAGIGYFWFRDHWKDEYSDTFEDPLFPGDLVTIHDRAEGRDTLARGFFPFLLAGVTIPVGSQVELMAEFQYDFDKKDAGFDLGGPIYLFGARLRF